MKKCLWFATASALALSVALSAAQTRTAKTLDIYVVDVEGGNATLFVSPLGESLLIDSGNGGPEGAAKANAVRDAGRIMAAAHDAGLTQIDHLITTHWHGDHFGGMAELAAAFQFATSSTMARTLPTISCAAPPTSFCRRPTPGSTAERRTRCQNRATGFTIAGLYCPGPDIGGCNDQNGIAGRRRCQSVLRRVQAGGEQCGGSDVGRHPRGVRTGSGRFTWAI